MSKDSCFNCSGPLNLCAKRQISSGLLWRTWSRDIGTSASVVQHKSDMAEKNHPSGTSHKHRMVYLLLTLGTGSLSIFPVELKLHISFYSGQPTIHLRLETTVCLWIPQAQKMPRVFSSSCWQGNQNSERCIVHSYTTESPFIPTAVQKIISLH